MPIRKLVVSLAVLGLTLAACRGTVPIGDLLDDPSRYDGETVRVKGTVEQSIGALGRGAYRVSDDSGTLNVVSENRGAPRQGAEVGIEGTFRSVFTFGDRTGAFLMETDRFDP